jgi:hypothetical protein
MIGNYYFENNEQRAGYTKDEPRIRALIATARVPLVWIAGHVHWNSFTLVNGQPHITLQSLTESAKTWPEPAGAFGMIELGEEIVWTVKGQEEASWTLRASDTLRRGITPMATFD